MATVFDVAQYVLEHVEPPITTIKLQKLVYYCQAWSLVWDDAPIFSDHIEAWASGPVVPSLFRAHKGRYYVTAEENAPLGNADALSSIQKESVDAVIKSYGDKDSQWLVTLTHAEDPWRLARERSDARKGQRSDEVITHADMAEYYAGLL